MSSTDKPITAGDVAYGAFLGLVFGMFVGGVWDSTGYDGLFAADIKTAQQACEPFGGLVNIDDPGVSDKATAECADGKRITFLAQTEKP